MKKEYLIYAVIPAIIFLIAVVSLIFSQLSTRKAITTEDESFRIFLKIMVEKDVLAGIIESLVFILKQAILPLLPFFILASISFLSIFMLKDKTKYFFLIPLIVITILTAFLTNFSIVILFTLIGILISSIVLYFTFQERKTNFSTGNNLVSDQLHLLSVFIAIGLFVNIYLNFESYRQMTFDSIVEYVKAFTPNADKINEGLKEQQINIVNDCTDSIERGINDSYAGFPPQTRQNCSQVHDTDIFVVNTYRQEKIAQINTTNTTVEEQLQQYIRDYYPMIEQMTKIVPLAIAASFYLLARILAFVISIVFGIAYAAIIKIKAMRRERVEKIEKAKEEKEEEVPAPRLVKKEMPKRKIETKKKLKKKL